MRPSRRALAYHPDDPPSDALDRSFAWLAEIAYSDVAIARSSTEDDLDMA